VERAALWHIAATFIDPFSRSPLSATQWLEQALDFVAEAVAAFGCDHDIARLSVILTQGTSADLQIDIYTRARAAGRQRLTATKEVIDWVSAETQSSGQTKP
jgi:carboxylate-amine ligase